MVLYSYLILICFIQIFVGGLLRETFEDTLVPWLEECGTLYDLRIMTNPNDGVNKGFAFAIFCSPDDAKTAVRKVIVMSHHSHSVLQNKLCQYNSVGSFPGSSISRLGVSSQNVSKLKILAIR